MGKLDYELNYFFQNNQVFADLINLCVYQGEGVVRPEELESSGTVLYSKDTSGRKYERRSDVSKRWKKGCSFRIFCLENESKISYIMPVRNMEYEAAKYREQVRKTAAEHKVSDYLDWNELSSHFTRQDRLYPVITLVLYWRREPWDGARCLLEMMDLSKEEGEKLKPFFQNYQINLVNMYDLKNADSCQGQLKYILKLLKKDQNKNELRKEILQNPEYHALEPETGKVISILLGDRKLKKYMEDWEGKGEKLNMCKALEDLWKDAEMEGQEKGMAKGLEKGIKKGEDYLARLIDCLLRDGRMEEVKCAVKDSVSRQKLYQEYGI